jgi:hypothetical protein
VRKQNSKKGRPRKVINQGKAKLSFTGKAVTSHAGMAIVSRALDYFNVREDLTSHTNDLDVAKHHKMNSLLEQLITLRMLGGEAVSDSAMLKDPALGALFDWDQDSLVPFEMFLHTPHGFEDSPAAGTAQQASAGQFRSFPLVEALLDKASIFSPGRFLLFAK